MNHFEKYNSKIKSFLKNYNRMNIINKKVLDVNNQELKPYDKQISDEEKEELLYFQNNVISDIKINNEKIGIVGIESLKAIAGGSYSLILNLNDKHNNKIIIKIQENEKMSDVEAYLMLTHNLKREISPYIIKMMGFFKSFDKFESFDKTVKYTSEKKYNKKMLNLYIIFECADGNIRELSKYFSNLKKENFQKWQNILNKFVITMIKGIKYLHETDNKYALLHLDIRPENIVYIKNNDDIEFKLIDIGSVVKYKYKENTEKERLRGSGIYSRYVYKNSPYRDYYNLWLSVCEVFDIFNLKSHCAKSRNEIRELVSNCHKQSEILSTMQTSFLSDIFKNENLINNLSNLHNAITDFRKYEKLNLNLSKEEFSKYTDKFILKMQ